MADSNSIEPLRDFFLRITDGLIIDAAQKNQKIPITSIRFDVDNKGGDLFAAEWFKYLIYGRGPGKAPPPIKMTAWVEVNPDVLERAKQVYKYVTAQSLGFLIGRKIAREGTDIFTGKKPGIDLLGVLDRNMPELTEQLARNEVIKVATDLSQAIK